MICHSRRLPRYADAMRERISFDYDFVADYYYCSPMPFIDVVTPLLSMFPPYYAITITPLSDALLFITYAAGLLSSLLAMPQHVLMMPPCSCHDDEMLFRHAIYTPC